MSTQNQSQIQIISIVGPTATGKTDLALFLAEELLSWGNEGKDSDISIDIANIKPSISGINIISADSRQVYQGLEISTGADIPENFEAVEPQKHQTNTYPYFTDPQHNINIHGVSIINPNQDWSLAHFVKMAQQIIQKGIEDNYLTIVVGGTSLYHSRLFDNNLDIKIKPNPKIRNKAEKMTLAELQNWLRKINPSKLSQMNQSDINNPRRLIRTIEIGLSPKNINNEKKEAQKFDFTDIQQLMIGLKINLKILEAKIKSRVKKRWEKGSEDEIQKAITRFPQPDLPAMSATGVKEIADYLMHKTDQKKLLELWALHEYQYAKRQITWWKKYPQVEWFDATDKQLQNKTQDWLKQKFNT
jgi:tRNA dimethylallyltransferase